MLVVEGLWFYYKVWEDLREGKRVLKIDVERKSGKVYTDIKKAINRIFDTEEYLIDEYVFGIPLNEEEDALIRVRYLRSFSVSLEVNRAGDDVKHSFCKEIEEGLGDIIEKLKLDGEDRRRKFVLVLCDYFNQLLSEVKVSSQEEAVMRLQKMQVRMVFPSEKKVPRKLLDTLLPVYLKLYAFAVENVNIREAVEKDGLYGKALAVFYQSLVYQGMLPYTDLDRISPINLEDVEDLVVASYRVPFVTVELIKKLIDRIIKLTGGESIAWYYEHDRQITGSSREAGVSLMKLKDAMIFFTKDVSEYEVEPAFVEHMSSLMRFFAFVCFPRGVSDALPFISKMRESFDAGRKRDCMDVVEEFLTVAESNFVAYSDMVADGERGTAQAYLRKRGIKPEGILLARELSKALR